MPLLKTDSSTFVSRRALLKQAGAMGVLAAVGPLLAGCGTTPLRPSSEAGTPPAILSGEVIDLVIRETPFVLGGRTASAITINGTIPGPLIRLKEGQHVTIHVRNELEELSSIHWHGLLLPPQMDGVPGVSYGAIKPKTTFTYQFPIRQSGTYWYHSHSGGQESQGMYAPMILEPRDPEPLRYDREYVVMLSEWTFESPEAVFDNLKKFSGYYNFQKRDLGEFIRDVGQSGFWPTLVNYLMWDQMRMDPTDFADVTGSTYTYLMNGHSAVSNWTAIYRQGERVRLRFINAASMTFFDVRIPGMMMTVIQADGQNIQPVTIEEFRFGPAETYDVIVEPSGDYPYTIFAESMDRSGSARGTLAQRHGLVGVIPESRPRPLRTMEDMGMRHNDHAAMSQHKAQDNGSPKSSHDDTGDHGIGGHAMKAPDDGRGPVPDAIPVKHGPDHHGVGNQMIAEVSQSRLSEPGRGLEGSGRRVLVYSDLKSLTPSLDERPPDHEIELHVTGHMQRYMWSFDGNKYSDAPQPIRFRYGERIRLTFVNDTMMDHPLHLHGMWMHLENGAGAYRPRKHTVVVKPAERLSVAIDADAWGPWAFHCHLLLHMEAGMFRVVQVSE